MKHTSNTEVLVVGAGPVGMMVALLLSRAGINVQIIDEAERTTAQLLMRNSPAFIEILE